MERINFLNLEYVFLRIVSAFRNFDIVALLNGLIYWVEVLRPYLVAIIIILVYVSFYSIIRLKQVEREEERKFHTKRLQSQAEAAAIVPEQDTELQDKWMKVQAHINSENPGDWRLAILEADIMLGDVLEKMGYQGDSIGDKLRSIDKSDFLTLDLAWEAHKIRNQIAHEGSDFQLNQREAKRAIDLYQKVFEEFYHI